MELNLENSKINNDDIIEITSVLTKLSKLSYLELDLKDNYIDNVGFEMLMNNLNKECEIKLNLDLNNIVDVDLYVN